MYRAIRETGTIVRTGLLCLLLAACVKRTPRDSTGLTITPGVGISNVLELSMTPRKMKKMTGDLMMKDLSLKKPKLALGWAIKVPSLGADWEQEDPASPPPRMSFLVSSEVIEDGPEHRKFARFRGKVEGGLSFAADGGVTRDQVIARFGPPMHVLEERIDSRQAMSHIRQWTSEGASYAWQGTSMGAESLYYPTNGICFSLHSNKVVVVDIFRAVRIAR